MKRAVIVGASSGIGREMAIWLAKSGWTVAVVARRLDALQELCATDPVHMIPFCFDVNNQDQIIDQMNKISKQLGGLDLFVISVGTGFINPKLDISLEIDTVRTNVLAFSTLADWAYSYFDFRGYGQIAAITSVGGMVAEAAAPAYSASKAYQINYLDALAKKSRSAHNNVIITEIRPGSVDTAMMKGSGHFWIGKPDKVAAIACRAIMKKKRLQYALPRWRIIGLLLRVFSIFS